MPLVLRAPSFSSVPPLVLPSLSTAQRSIQLYVFKHEFRIVYKKSHALAGMSRMGTLTLWRAAGVSPGTSRRG